MTANPSVTGVEPPAVAGVEPRRASRRTGMQGDTVLAWAMGSLLAAVLVVAAVSFREREDSASAGLPPGVYSAPILPAEPVDGALTLVTPPGAAADQQAGGRGYEMPDVIRLHVGDTIVLRNGDTAPHMILYAFLMPGESDARTLTEPGSEFYSSGRRVHAASFLNFTTIFVAERTSGRVGALRLAVDMASMFSAI